MINLRLENKRKLFIGYLKSVGYKFDKVDQTIWAIMLNYHILSNFSSSNI